MNEVFCVQGIPHLIRRWTRRQAMLIEYMCHDRGSISENDSSHTMKASWRKLNQDEA